MDIIRDDKSGSNSRLIPLLRNQREQESAARQPQFLGEMRFIWSLIPNGCNWPYKTCLWYLQLCPFRITVAIYIHKKALKDTTWGPVFNRAKTNNVKMKGHPKVTLDAKKVKVKVIVAQSLRPTDCSLPGSSVYGILQTRILEWVAIPFFRGSSWPRDWTQVSCTAGRVFTESPGKPWMLKSHTQNKISGLREFDGPVSLFSNSVLCFGLSSNLA